MSVEDKIDTNYICKTVEIIKDAERYQMLEEPNLEPIVIALRNGPKTVNELELEYNVYVQEKIQKMNLTRREEEVLEKKMFRQAKTLYKYIKVLKENSFVIEAGKRYTKNQRAAETLYGRTAKLFFYTGGKEHWINSESVKPSLEFLSRFLGMVNQSKKPNVKSLGKFLNSVETKMNQDLTMLFTQYSEELAEISEAITYEDLRFFIQGLNLILIMKNYPEFEEKMKRSKII